MSASLRAEDPGKNIVHYVATNDHSAEDISALHRLGFCTRDTLRFRMTSLEEFVTEAQLMAVASSFFYGGISGVHTLFMRMRTDQPTIEVDS